MTIGHRIKAAREMVQPRLSTKELDRLAEITEGHTWTIEKSEGKRTPEANTLDRIARVLGLTLDYVIRGDGDSPSAQQVNDAVRTARSAHHADAPSGSAA